MLIMAAVMMVVVIATCIIGACESEGYDTAINMKGRMNNDKKRK